MKEKLQEYLHYYNLRSVVYVLENNDEIRLFVSEDLARQYKKEEETLYKATKIIGDVEFILIEKGKTVFVEEVEKPKKTNKKNKNK